MCALRKIARDGVSDQVYRQLKENVISGVWQPGVKLPSENQLVALLGVSRVSIRSAIQKLVMLGMLETKTGEGTYVKAGGPGEFINELFSMGLKPKDQIEIVEFRKALETEALKLAVERATDDDIAELEAIHTRARAAHKEKNLEAYFKEDIDFHTQVFKMSKNSIFIMTFQNLQGILFPHFYTVARDFFEMFQLLEDREDNHTAIVEGLKKRNVKTCIKAYTKLVKDLITMNQELLKKVPEATMISRNCEFCDGDATNVGESHSERR
jgi:GntR family transcriptional regulator, transcriptional repressor for pyruvate dehydrogenase complex